MYKYRTLKPVKVISRRALGLEVWLKCYSTCFASMEKQKQKQKTQNKKQLAGTGGSPCNPVIRRKRSGGSWFEATQDK
jgi:hypothetical protein